MKKNLHFAAIFTLSLIISQTSTSAFSQTTAQFERCASYMDRQKQLIQSLSSRLNSGDFCRDQCVGVKIRDDINNLSIKAAKCFESIGQYEMANYLYKGNDQLSIGKQDLDYQVYKTCGCKMVSD